MGTGPPLVVPAQGGGAADPHKNRTNRDEAYNPHREATATTEPPRFDKRYPQARCTIWTKRKAPARTGALQRSEDVITIRDLGGSRSGEKPGGAQTTATYVSPSVAQHGCIYILTEP